MRFRCPYCGEDTISVYDKIRLNPRHKIKCNGCGGYINIPYYILLLFGIIIFVVIYVMGIVLSLDRIYVIVTLVSVTIVYELIVIFYVPIIKK